MRKIRVSDYFRETDTNLSPYDRRKLQELRDTLNGFTTQREQAEYIKRWRSFKENREWDYKTLRLEKHLDIDPDQLITRLGNKYYKKHVSDMDRYFDMEKEESKRSKKEKAKELKEQEELRKKAEKDKKELAKKQQAAEDAQKEADRLKQEAAQAELEAEALENKERELVDDTNLDDEEDLDFDTASSDSDSDLIEEDIEDDDENSEFKLSEKDDDLEQDENGNNLNSFSERMRREKNKKKEGKGDKGLSDKAKEAKRKAEEARRKAEKAQKVAENAAKTADAAAKAAEASEAAAAAAGTAGSATATAQTGLSALASAAEPILITIAIIAAIIVIINICVYIAGGVDAMFGHTPFAICDSVQMEAELEIDDEVFTKVITVDGTTIKLPANAWAYGDTDLGFWGSYEEGDQGTVYENMRSKSESERVLKNCYAQDADRGIGVFYEEDLEDMYFADGRRMWTNGPDTWSINMRWEYAPQYIAQLGKWAGSGGDDRCHYKDQILAATDSGYASANMDEFNALMKCKLLVVNPANGKACVCYPGDGHSMANWGPGLENRIGGLSHTAMAYLDYWGDGGAHQSLQVYFIDVDDPSKIEPGPYYGISLDTGNGCKGQMVNVIDTTTAGRTASSLSWGGWTGTGKKKWAYGSCGVDGYNNYLEGVLEPWESAYHGCCASFVGAILLDHGMIMRKDYLDREYTGFCGCNPIYCYMYDHPYEWEEFYPTSVDDMRPGDVLLYWSDTSLTKKDGWYRNGRDNTHIAICGEGTSDGTSGLVSRWYELCQASREFEGPDPGPASDATSYAAWSIKMKSVPTTDDSGRHISYFRYKGPTPPDVVSAEIAKKAVADDCSAKINALTSPPNASAVSEARAAYDALDDWQKDFVTDETYQKLLNAESEVAAAQTVANGVISQINALGSPPDEAAVQAARAAYDALTDLQKSLVDGGTYSKLTTAESEVEAAKAAATTPPSSGP